MITNLLATIIVSVITNFTPVYAPVNAGMFYVDSAFPTVVTTDWNLPFRPEMQGEYLGEDGLVIEVTEIKFKYEGKDIVHRIEKPLKKIVRRCKEKPPAKPELIWDEDVIEEIKPAVDLSETNTAIIVDIESSTITITP